LYIMAPGKLIFGPTSVSLPIGHQPSFMEQQHPDSGQEETEHTGQEGRVLGCQRRTVEVLGDRSMMSSLMDNTSHLMQDTVAALQLLQPPAEEPHLLPLCTTSGAPSRPHKHVNHSNLCNINTLWTIAISARVYVILS